MNVKTAHVWAVSDKIAANHVRQLLVPAGILEVKDDDGTT